MRYNDGTEHMSDDLDDTMSCVIHVYCVIHLVSVVIHERWLKQHPCHLDDINDIMWFRWHRTQDAWHNTASCVMNTQHVWHTPTRSMYDTHQDAACRTHRTGGGGAWQQHACNTQHVMTHVSCHDSCLMGSMTAACMQHAACMTHHTGCMMWCMTQYTRRDERDDDKKRWETWWDTLDALQHGIPAIPLQYQSIHDTILLNLYRSSVSVSVSVSVFHSRALALRSLMRILVFWWLQSSNTLV